MKQGINILKKIPFKNNFYSCLKNDFTEKLVTNIRIIKFKKICRIVDLSDLLIIVLINKFYLKNILEKISRISNNN